MKRVEARHYRELDISDLINGVVKIIAEDGTIDCMPVVYTSDNKSQNFFVFESLGGAQRVLANVAAYLGMYNIDPEDRLEYLLETTDSGNSFEWFQDDKGGFYRWVIKAQTEVLDDYKGNLYWNSEAPTERQYMEGDNL